MRKLGEEIDTTMLLVTHEMGFAHDFADRVLFFDGGWIVEEGASSEIFTINELFSSTRAATPFN